MPCSSSSIRPGGALDTTKEVVQAILGARVPVIVYVSPSGASASSAGTFVTLAAHVVAMAPGTTIGAAHPVTIFPSDKSNETMEKKVENYAVSFIEAIAAQRGRNVSWAAEAVRESASITDAQALEKKVIDVIAARGRAAHEVVMFLGFFGSIVVLALIFLWMSVNVVNEYQRLVVFRLGRLVAARGPGLVLIIPVIERAVRMDLRVVTLDVPPQDVITRDNVSVKVNAVVYFRVLDPNKAL